MVKRLGLIGISKDNGHPYSWGAIINGYNDEILKNSNWEDIYEYVRKRDISEFTFPDVKITHVWTQDKSLSINLQNAICAENIVENYVDLIGKVDAVIIARDDYEHHLEMAKPFLEAGLKVFIDKPLTLDIGELKYFKEFLYKGQLMSVAGMRFARELDDLRANIDLFGKLKIIQSNVINDWEKYGIHIIDGVLSVINEIPYSIEYVHSTNLYIVRFKSGLLWTINMLGSAPKTFSIEVWGEKKRVSVEINDNFSMFRRMLYRFSKFVTENTILYNPINTLISISLLIAGRDSKIQNKEILLKDIFKTIGLNEYE